MMNKEQPQFNMSAVFTSHRGNLGDSSPTPTGLFGQISPPPASVTPEIDAVDDVMKWVKKNDADESDEDEDEERVNEPHPLSVNESSVNGVMDRQLHDSFSIGDPPLLPTVNNFSRTLSTPLFGGSSSSVMGLGGLGNSLSQQPAPRLTPPPGSASVKDDPFHFGAPDATLSKAPSSNPLGSNSIDPISNLGLFGTPLVSQVDSKPFQPLGQGFSLTPPPTSTETNVFAPSAPIPFHISPLGSLTPPSGTPSASSSLPATVVSSSPKMQLLFPSQQLQTQSQTPPPIQPKLQPPPVQPTVTQPPVVTQPSPQPQQPVQPQSHSSQTTSSQTHFVGTAAVFVPKSMMTASAGANEASSSAPGSVHYGPHKDFGSYSHPGMFNQMSSETHTEMTYPPGGSGYGMDSSSPPQVVTGMSNNNNYRTKGCWYFFQTGHCQKGERCNFSHDRRDGMEIAPPVPSANVPGMYLPYGYGVVPDGQMSGSPRSMGKNNGIGPFGVPPQLRNHSHLLRSKLLLHLRNQLHRQTLLLFSSCTEQSHAVSSSRKERA